MASFIDTEPDWRAIRAKFEAKLAKMRAKGVVVLEGSTLYWKLWEASR